MDEKSSKVSRALGAMREDVWTELQHRRVGDRIDRAASLPVRPASRGLSLAVAAAIAGVCVVVATHVIRKPPVVAEGSMVGNGAESTSAALSDGSKVEVERGGQVRVVKDRLDETRVEVLGGRADFEVTKRPGRPFVASVRGVEVRVVGTRFSTELDLTRPPGLVHVRVRRGVVEVRRRVGDTPTRLGAGDAIDVPIAPVPPLVPAVDSASAGAGANPSSADVPPAPPPIPPVTPAISAVPPVGASSLFNSARAARAVGNVEGAAKLYAALLKQFPSDERAGVAALELGRLRMDAQRSYRPAAEAFRRAIAAAPNEGVREDALARLIAVLDAMHESDGCQRERARYLQRYPRGLYVSQVGRACGQR
jgi:transmembrane sensor